MILLNFIINQMEYKVDFDIKNFKFWSGAKLKTENLTLEQLEALGEYIEECFSYGNTPTDTQINDFVWFECDDFIEKLTQNEEEEEDNE